MIVIAHLLDGTVSEVEDAEDDSGALIDCVDMDRSTIDETSNGSSACATSNGNQSVMRRVLSLKRQHS